MLLLSAIFFAFILVVAALIFALPHLFRGPWKGTGYYPVAFLLALCSVGFLVWVSRFIAMDYPLPPGEDPFLGKTRCMRSIEVNLTKRGAFDLCLRYADSLQSKVILAADCDQGYIQVITPDAFTQIIGNCTIQFIIRFELEPVTADKTAIQYSSRYAPLGARGIESDREGMNVKKVREIGEFLEQYRVSCKD